MIKIQWKQIESKIQEGHILQNKKYGYNVEMWDYDLTIDTDLELVDIYITFSSGDVLDFPLNYKVEER